MLKTVDPGFGTRVSDELRCHGIYVETNVRVERIDREDTRLHVIGSNQFQPNSELARVAGIEVGERGAIYVSRRMETNLPDIYAAGDCVETWHRVLNLATYLPLGSTAHKQGFVAGENAVGGAREFAGIVGTRVVKVFDLVIARTGLRDQEAAQAGFDPFTVETATWDHKVYYPEAREVRIRLTGDRKTGLLLGAQMLGHVHSESAKRIDIFATALFQNMRIEELNDLDLSYTPPLGNPWDSVQMSAQSWMKALR